MTRLAPVMGSAIPGSYVTAAFWNANVKALGDFMSNPPMFSGYLSGTMSVPNNAFTGVILDTETIDTDGGHITTSNSQRYTCQVAGVYELSGVVVFPAGGTGQRGAGFAKNGSATLITGSENLVSPVSAIATVVPALTTFVRLDVGDYVWLAAYQNTGAAVSTTTVGGAFPTLNVKWISA